MQRILVQVRADDAVCKLPWHLMALSLPAGRRCELNNCGLQNHSAGQGQDTRFVDTMPLFAIRSTASLE